MFVFKVFALYDDLTHIQLCNTYLENISCVYFSYFLTSTKIVWQQKFLELRQLQSSLYKGAMSMLHTPCCNTATTKHTMLPSEFYGLVQGELLQFSATVEHDVFKNPKISATDA